MAMQHHPKPFFSFIQLLSCSESFFMENGSCVLCSGSLLCFPLLFALSRHTYGVGLRRGVGGLSSDYIWVRREVGCLKSAKVGLRNLGMILKSNVIRIWSSLRFTICHLVLSFLKSVIHQPSMICHLYFRR